MIYLLSNKKIYQENIQSFSVLDINFLDVEVDLYSFDTLLFTSKNGVKAIDSLNKSWRKIRSFAISNITANSIVKFGGKLEYVGNSSTGDEFAHEIKDVLKNRKVLYLRAKKVVSNLINILKQNGIDIQDVAIYETICKKQKKIDFEKNSIFVFTSPSTIECFFKQFKWDGSFKAIAIGETTAKYLPKEVKYFISPKTDIKECIKLANEIVKR